MTRSQSPVTFAAALALLAGAACASPQAAQTTPSGTTLTRPGRVEPFARPGATLTLREAAETITPADVYARIEFLASDQLRGRETPSPELEIAASYLVNQYKLFGFAPAGEAGTFYQWYPLPRQAPEVRAPNVVAMIPGSDPTLRGEYVVISAHLDHVGVGRPVDGDSIYNGADDDASGNTALLEVAQAMSLLAERPRRTVVFLHVSGEEKGLWGSEWYSDHPTLPLENIVANLNVDMIGRNDPGQVVVIGKGYSSLGTVAEEVQRAHPELRLTVSDDPWPEERFFFRSDHFNFARKEVPAIFFFSGVHADYHRPSDEVEKIDTDKAARIARFVLYTAFEVANAPERPRWHPAGLQEVRGLTR